jgi:hypothetical protein
MAKKVTRHVEYGLPDDEHLPITKCVCGAKIADKCPECGRGLYFSIAITVYEA